MLGEPKSWWVARAKNDAPSVCEGEWVAMYMKPWGAPACAILVQDLRSMF